MTGKAGFNLKDLTRYRAVIIAVALFLVFDLGVLVTNFMVSNEIRNDALGANLAGRQRMLSQRMVKTLLQIQNARISELDERPAIEELKNTYTLFNSTLQAFLYGGETQNIDGTMVEFAAVDHPKAVAALNDALLIWNPYKKYLTPVIISEVRTENEEVSSAITYASANNLKLLKLMDDLSNALTEIASDRTILLQRIQVAGITFATINFFIILLHFIRNLRESDETTEAHAKALEVAKKETDEIFDNVGEGLFLLNLNGEIGNQYSKQLEDILMTNGLANKPFLNILRPLLNDKLYGMVSDYIELMFRKKLKEKMIQEHNPLDEIELNFESSHGGFVTKYLSFKFNRIIHDGDIKYLLVSVYDVTSKVVLARQLEESEEKSKQQMDLLFGLIHIGPSMLKEFIDDSQSQLNEINNVLKAVEHHHDYRSVIDPIFRMVHNVKGNAGLLDLMLFVDQCHTFEEEIVRLRDFKGELTGEDLIPITLQLNSMGEALQNTTLMMQQLSKFQHVFTEQESKTADTGLVGSIDRMVGKLTTQFGNKVKLHSAEFKAEDIPEKYGSLVSDILIQIIKNSVAHGIEKPEERETFNKPVEGNIHITSQVSQDVCELYVLDDGRGLDIDSIRKAAEQSEYCDVDHLQDQEVASLIFEPGFSTVEKANVTAGRGIGMDIIKEKLQEIGGRLQLQFSQGKGCLFKIVLPIS